MVPPHAASDVVLDVKFAEVGIGGDAIRQKPVQFDAEIGVVAGEETERTGVEDFPVVTALDVEIAPGIQLEDEAVDTAAPTGVR